MKNPTVLWMDEIHFAPPKTPLTCWYFQENPQKPKVFSGDAQEISSIHRVVGGGWGGVQVAEKMKSWSQDFEKAT